MTRTGLFVALAVAVAVGLLFGLYPNLDLKIEQPFFDATGIGFWMRVDRGFLGLRDASNLLTTMIAASSVIALVAKLILPRLPLLMPARAIVLMLTTLALGPGLTTNVVLKDYWGRPRPIDVQQFGGDDPFVPWWDPRGTCPKNCSFIAGEPSGAFWTLTPAALMPPQWRPIAYGAAIAFGAGVGFLRMASGAHFFTDVVFAGVLTFLIIWVTYAILYRWRTRITDETVERALERVAMPGYLLVARARRRIGGLTTSSIKRRPRTDVL